jgi:single-stranded DNA-binding protein
MKTITFDGRIGASGAEVRTTKGGKPYVRFSVANNSFANGAEKTEWYEVTSYDEYIINNRVKYLTKGTYVIITGNPNIEVNVRDGKIWLNQYITASTIDTPSFKKKEDDTTTSSVSESAASTFTGGTESQHFVPTPTPEPAPAYVSSVASESSAMAYGSSDDVDDMPF